MQQHNCTLFFLWGMHLPNGNYCGSIKAEGVSKSLISSSIGLFCWKIKMQIWQWLRTVEGWAAIQVGFTLWGKQQQKCCDSREIISGLIWGHRPVPGCPTITALCQPSCSHAWFTAHRLHGLSNEKSQWELEGEHRTVIKLFTFLQEMESCFGPEMPWWWLAPKVDIRGFMVSGFLLDWNVLLNVTPVLTFCITQCHIFSRSAVRGVWEVPLKAESQPWSWALPGVCSHVWEKQQELPWLLMMFTSF